MIASFISFNLALASLSVLKDSLYRVLALFEVIASSGVICSGLVASRATPTLPSVGCPVAGSDSVGTTPVVAGETFGSSVFSDSVGTSAVGSAETCVGGCLLALTGEISYLSSSSRVSGLL